MTLQIYFYDQWDKQSSKEPSSTSQDHSIFPIRIIRKLKSLNGRQTNLILIIIAVMTAFVFSYLIFFGEPGQALSDHSEQTMVKPNGILYTVQKGDTLWTLASEHYPELSREQAIAKIQQQNGFQGTTIHAGQSIWLP